MNTKKGLKLQIAICLLVIFSVLISVAVNWYSAANAMKKSLIEEFLESNYTYAKKLSLNTRDLLHMMQQNIIASSQVAGNEDVTQESLDAWKAANGMDFNTVFITDQDGVIKTISPSLVEFNKTGFKVESGIKIESDTVKEALAMKKPFISKPYTATSGQMLILITAPIFDPNGKYMGLMGGTIYLESDSVLRNIFRNHEYDNGSYVYVVDQTGRILYHPDSSRINEVVTNNAVIKRVIHGDSGTAHTNNSHDTEFFMGYAYEQSTGWGIISQTPASVLQEPLHNLLKEMAIQSLPLLILIILIAACLANTLSKPLNILAKFSKDSITKKSNVSIENLEIHSNIYEVRELYHHFKNHIDSLKTQVEIDGLTGIANRRSFDTVMKEFVETKTPFSLIILDIDNFKLVNDTYGHIAGDEVLRYLSRMMESLLRNDDTCYRYGGEEFVILVKQGQECDAFKIAEQLRTQISKTNSPTGNPITISLGITSLQPQDQQPNLIIERADAALYQSKSEGKNRTTIYYDKYHSITV